MVIYESGAVMSQARSLWRLELIRTKWAGGFINWGYPLRIVHIITGRYLGINDNNDVWLVSRENATVAETAFCLKQNKDDKKIAIDEKEEEVIGLPLIKYGDTSFFLQHIESSCWLSYKSYETKKRHIGRVEEKQAILSEEGKMDDGLEFSRSQEEEAKTARVIRKCGIMFNKFILILDSLYGKRFHGHGQNFGSSRSTPIGPVSLASPIMHQGQSLGALPLSDQEEMIMCLEDLIAYFEQPEEDIDHEEKQLKFKALRNRQDLFQEEGILNLILETIDKINAITTQGLLNLLLGEESSQCWDLISSYLYQLLAAVIKGNHTNCAHFAQAHRLDWLFSRFSSQAAGEGTGMLDVLHCVLTDSPEALNMMKENHIKVIISLLEKHGRDPKVLEVLCSLCVGNGVAVRSSQNNICDNLLPGRNLLLQTRLVDHVSSMRPNIFVGKVEGSSMYTRWYLELTLDYLEQVTHLELHFRVGWANTLGYVPYPGGGPKWGGNGVGDDLFSYGFDGKNFWTSGISNEVRTVKDGEAYLKKGDVIGCILDLNIPLITFTVNGMPVRGCFKGFNTDGMFYPVVSFSAKYSCRFLFGGHHGRLKYGPPKGHAPLVEALLPGQKLQIDKCFQFGELSKNIIYGPCLELTDDATFVPRPVDTSSVVLPQFLETIKDKLAENMHEVWAMNKISSGWSYAEVRKGNALQHPSLTSFEKLPESEKKYDTFFAMEILKTIISLGFRISLDKPPGRIKILRLPNDTFLQSNGYKPAPLDLTHINLNPEIEELIEYLAENAHNVWAAERIKKNWTYGLTDDYTRKRSSHLVSYKYVDETIKKANVDTASETVKTLMAYGYIFEPPTKESSELETVLGKGKSSDCHFRSYRAEKTYAVTNGKWYFEVEILSKGLIKTGWATLNFTPSRELGRDEHSWSFDCNLSRKFHADASESFGKPVNYGDIIGCFLDLNDRTIGFSLNGELLLDASGGELAFTDIAVSNESFVPAITLGVGQKVRLIFGQDVNSLKCFTACGLQDGYQPFCINMNRNMSLWYNKDEPLFMDVKENNSNVDVIRIPGGNDSSPALKIVHKMFEFQEKVGWEFLRLSLPVNCNEVLIDEIEREKRWEEMVRRKRQKRVENVNLHHPGNLEQHMLESGFSLADVKNLQRTYSECPSNFSEDNESSQTSFDSSVKTGFSPSPPIQKSNLAINKNKSSENLLTVPSFNEAQAIMREREELANKQSSSAEQTRQTPRSTSNEETRKKRSKSPFKLFSRSDPTPPPLRSTRTREVKPNISVLSPDVPFGQAQNRSMSFRSSPRPSINVRRPSRVNLSEALPNETTDQLESSSLELVDEYFFGVRIFPGQDPSHVYCGWVVSNFRHYDEHFNANKVRKVTIQVWAEHNNQSECFDRQNCYMLNAGQLYQDVNDMGVSSGRSNQGMFVGCHIDVSTGTLTFTADGKTTKYRFKLEPGTKLYPAVFFEATSKECFQFELGRTPTTLSLSSAILKSSEKHLTPQCPPRLKIQSLQRYQWARVGNISLKPHALKLSDIRGWSMLIDDPVSMLALHIPEEDRCIDILELIEHEKLLTFHAGTLALYGALCFQGNTRAAHIICSHVDEKQLMCAIQDQYISGILRSGFADLLISLHLESGAYARMLTQNEFIIPLEPELNSLYGPIKVQTKSMASVSNVSIRPKIKQSKRVDKVDTIKGLSSPYFPLDTLKSFVMEALDEAVKKSNRPMRDPIGGSNTSLFVPLLKLIDKLLLIGSLNDNDLQRLLVLIDPQTFDTDYDSKSENNSKGLMQMPLDEGVKLQMCYILHHLFDIHLHHKVGAIVSFSTRFVGDVQSDQKRRYTAVSQEELPAAVAAKKTKEFRSAPKDQMKLILDFKNVEEDQSESCPCVDNLRQLLYDIHNDMMNRTKLFSKKLEKDLRQTQDQVMRSTDQSWHHKLLTFVNSAHIANKTLLAIEGKENHKRPEDVFHLKVVNTVTKWAQDSEIENRELIRQMFYLLLRSYNGVGELMDALEKTYVTSAVSKEDVIRLLEDLGTIRALLPVQMSPEEEQIMRETLWTLVMNKVFFQHPDLIRILRVHENIMDIMTNTLSKRAQRGQTGNGSKGVALDNQESSQKTAIGDTSAMVVACCRFLCYFCRSSRQNQRAMFQHLDFLLKHSNILLSRPSLRGSTPLDVASFSVMDNPDLALALRENFLEQIAIYLSKCGFQSNQELLDRGYPDLGWDPVEGERYLDFFRTCVWVNGESVEENANLVIRLLIRRPESLGPALRGEGEGLLQAIKDSIAMSERIQQSQDNVDSKDEDYIDLGTAILNFYCGLVDLLGRCAPEPATIAVGKNDCLRARAILKSLVLMQDLEGVLALRFNLQSNSDSEVLTGFVPAHKQSIVLFLERVYGIENQEIFFRLLEEAFLPDLRAAIMLEMQGDSESQMALALNRYLGNAVLPLLNKYSHFYADADNWASLMDASLHTIYRLSKIKVLTKGQRDSVSDFLVALTREMQPSMLLNLLRKLTIDVSVLTEYSTVALRLLTLHYERCGKYYGHGGQGTGVATAEERKLTMLLFSNIFDSLAKMEYDPDLFNKALPCLTALAGALPPDYSFTSSDEDTLGSKTVPDEGPYIPNPVNIENISLTSELRNLIQRFTEHYHELWAQRKFENGWNYGDTWNFDRKLHPRLKPFHLLSEYEKTEYKEPITDLVKTLLALDWSIDQKDTNQSLTRGPIRIEAKSSIANYNPQPVDTSSLTLSRDIQTLAERLAQNSHEIWALQTSKTMNNSIHPQMVPYDLLTDREKRKNREQSQELLKYMQYEGWRIQK